MKKLNVLIMLVLSIVFCLIAKAKAEEASPIPVYQNVYDGPSSTVGPIRAKLILTTQTVEIEYVGRFANQGAQLGVVQNGNLIGYVNLSQNIGISESAHIPFKALHPGFVQFFVKSFDGHYDSNYGKNYTFWLPKSLL